MSYESTETKEFEMRRDMDILEIFSVTCVICQGHKKREREIVRCNDTVAIQRFHLTFVFKKMVNVATNDAFFPRASLLNAIVQQVESPARESMETSVMDVIATRNVSVFITFFYVEKKTLDSIMQTIEQASLLPAYQLRSSSLSYPRTSELLPYRVIIVRRLGKNGVTWLLPF